ncbi:MAG: hypothetical protein FH762_01220 [Firmicutes bacterium]|nr:hypothetical protein [Bacillota bacterium]
MSISPRKFSTNLEENKRLFRLKLLEIISSLEGDENQFEPNVYSDGMGVPTIGYGYALIVKRDLWVARERSEINSVLPDGLQITEDEYEVLEDIVDDVLNKSIVENNKENTDNILFDDNGNNRISLELTEEQAGKIVENIARPEIDTWIKRKFRIVTGNNDLFNQLDYSKEMAALTSIIYQGPIYVFKNNNLVNAIITGDRARAWFEIRYFSNNLTNGVNRRGWAHRKCKEAQVFGLYQDSKNIKPEEAQRFLKLLNTKIFAEKSSFTNKQINRTGLTYEELKDMTALEYIRHYERVSNVDPSYAQAGNSRTIDEIIAEAKIKARGPVLYELSANEEDLLERFYGKKEWEDESNQGEYIRYIIQPGDNNASNIAAAYLDCSYTHLRKKDSDDKLTNEGLGNIHVGGILYLPVNNIKDEYNNNDYIKQGEHGYELRENWSGYNTEWENIIPRTFQSGQPSYTCSKLSNDFLEMAVNIERDKIYIPANHLVYEELVSRFKKDYKSNYIEYLTAMTGKEVESVLLDNTITNNDENNNNNDGQINNKDIIEKLLINFNDYFSEYCREMQGDTDGSNENRAEIIYFSRQSNFDYFRALDGVVTIFNIIYYIINECNYVLPEDEFLEAFNEIFSLTTDEWAQVSSWTNTDIDQDGTIILDIVNLIITSCDKVSGDNKGPDPENYSDSLNILNSLLAGVTYDCLDYPIQQLEEKKQLEKTKVCILLKKHFDQNYHKYFYEYSGDDFPLDIIPVLKDKENRGNIIDFAENLLVRFIEVQAGCEADTLSKNIMRWYHRSSKLTLLSENGFYNDLTSNFSEIGLRILAILNDIDIESDWKRPVIDRLNDFLNLKDTSYNDLMDCMDTDYDDYLINNFDDNKYEGIRSSDKELKESLVEKYKDYTYIVDFVNSIDEELIELVAVELLDKENIIRRMAVSKLKNSEGIA